jgi:hypothetical protein
MVVQRLLLLVRLFGHLPKSFSSAFAGMLNGVTRPFHVINYYGSCLAARVYNRRRMVTKFDRVIDSLEQSVMREHDDAFRGGMHYPAGICTSGTT